MNKVIIIAEAGVNHNGSLPIAKKLIEEAKKCGADYVKFQTFKTDLIISKEAKKAEYQLENTDNDDSQYNMIKRLELNFEQFKELKNYSDKIGIGFLASGFDIESILFLRSLNIDFFKVPSGEITNKFLLEKLSDDTKPILLSTGISNEKEISDAIKILSSKHKQKKIILFHCNSEYPTPFIDANLKAIKMLKKIFRLEVGYSDHTIGIEASIASIPLGATFIEKHFTLDKTFKGPDHKSSLNPNELKELVTCVRNVESALKLNGEIIPTKSEIKNINHVRKSLYFKKNLKKGSILKKRDLISLRPGNGISPMNYESYLGKVLVNDVLKYQLLKKNHFES